MNQNIIVIISIVAFIVITFVSVFIYFQNPNSVSSTGIDCSFATMHIFDSTGTRIWSLDEPNSKCALGEAPEYLEKDFGPTLYELPVLSAGKYKVVANFENQEIEKEITVK